MVLGYIACSQHARDWHEGMVARARRYGFDVEAFCLTPGHFAPRYSFQQLDKLWRAQQTELVDMSRRLKSALADADVFWNFNGANVHPAIFQEIECLNLYGCFDDPEASASLSRHVAPYADACLIGNLACGPLYESWGVRHHAWAPLAFVGEDFDARLTPEQVLGEDRSVDLVFFGEREARYRRDRLDRLAEAFPAAILRGRGWPQGYASAEERRRTHRQARIGWNLHNSVGPVNLRFFTLLANGVLQICDNKCRAGQIFALDEEIVGFDSVEECIELTHYYLDNEDQRRRIAANGLRKYRETFTEEKVWQYYFDKFDGWLTQKEQIRADRPAYPRTTGRGYFDLGRVSCAGQALLKRFGYEVRRTPVPAVAVSVPDRPYTENPAAGGVNLKEKLERQATGGFFEWPNMVALNWAITKLIGDARYILDIGGGTGCFAFEAGADPKRHLVCTDMDAAVIDWARENRARENIRYITGEVPEDSGPFDLVVSVDVIEHVEDFSGFLQTCSRLAPRAIITTPNKARDTHSDTLGPPAYYQHVREWSAGEFYWVLRSFYKQVELYAMHDVYIPEVHAVDVQSTSTPLIAVCSDPV